MAQDKSGTDIAVGDTVSFVYGGDAHEGIVTGIEPAPPGQGVDHLAVTVEPRVPAGSVTVTKKAPKKAAEKPAPKTQDSKPTTHDSKGEK